MSYAASARHQRHEWKCCRLVAGAAMVYAAGSTTMQCIAVKVCNVATEAYLPYGLESSYMKNINPSQPTEWVKAGLR